MYKAQYQDYSATSTYGNIVTIYGWSGLATVDHILNKR